MTTRWPRARAIEASAAASLAGYAVFYWLRYLHRGINLLDEGSQAAQASRILQGELIYRDFTTAIAPASYYIVACLFQLFGRDLMVLRWAAFAVGMASLLVTYAIARHLAEWPFAAAAALLTTTWGWFLVTPNFYSLLGMCLSLAALLCLLRYFRAARMPLVVAAGLATAASIVTKQNTGIYTAVALFIALLSAPLFDNAIDSRGRRRASVWFAVSTFAPVALVLLLFVAAGAGASVYDNLVRYPLTVYRNALSLEYPSFYPLVPGAGLRTIGEALPAVVAGRVAEPAVFDFWIKLVLYLPLVIYPLALVIAAALAVRGRWRSDPTAGREAQVVTAVALVGAFTFLQAWPRSDFTHVVFGLPPAFVLLSYVSYWIWRGIKSLLGRLRARVASAAVTVAEVVAVAVVLVPEAALVRYGYKLTEFEYQNFTSALHADRARGILTSPEDAARIDHITEYLTRRTAPNEPILVVPWAAGFYFLTDRRNPTRVDIFYDGESRRHPCIVAALDRRPPRYVVYGYVWDIDGKHFRDYARVIDDYIRRHYVVAQTYPGYEIWSRREGVAPTSVDAPGRCAAEIGDRWR